VAWLDALQGSAFAQALAQSRWASAVLSSLHLIGFTLVMGAALVCHLRLAGAFSADRPPVEVTGPASRIMRIGLACSILTGGLLFTPRAAGAAANWIFQLKMALLAAGVVLQATAVPHAARAGDGPRVMATGLLGLLVWVGLALAGCAFILFE
jgi:hypothetical protein